MPSSTQENVLTVFAAGSISAEANVIFGVSVITEGVARGHGVYIDATTLLQVKECAEKYAGGVKVKMNHSGGAGDIVGFLRSFRVEGKKLLADLHLIKASPHRAYVLEIAETIPDTFGLSIAFSGPREQRGERTFARCTEIYSADLVTEPAANPSGLFDATGKGNERSNTPAQSNQPIQKMPETDIAELKTQLAALTTASTEQAARVTALEAAQATHKTELAAEIAKAHAAGALEAVKVFSASFGTPAAKGVTHDQDKKESKKFEDLVKERFATSKSQGEAIRFCQQANPTEHAEYVSRGAPYFKL